MRTQVPNLAKRFFTENEKPGSGFINANTQQIAQRTS